MAPEQHQPLHRAGATPPTFPLRDPSRGQAIGSLVGEGTLGPGWLVRLMSTGDAYMIPAPGGREEREGGEPTEGSWVTESLDGPLGSGRWASSGTRGT